MSLFSGLTDWLTTDTSKTQTAAEAQANIDALRGQLIKQGKPLPADGGQFIDPGAEANASLLNSLTDGVLGHPDPNAADTGTGFGALAKDVLLLAAIGGAIYLFVKLGGINQVKKIAGL